MVLEGVRTCLPLEEGTLLSRRGGVGCATRWGGGEEGRFRNLGGGGGALGFS